MATPEIEFDYNVHKSDDYTKAVRENGVAFLRGFVGTNFTSKMAERMMQRPFAQIDEWHRDHTIHEQFGLQEWVVGEAPEFEEYAVRRAGEMVRFGGIPWFPTAMRAQLYSSGNAGVDWHRDFASSRLVVGVLNVSGEAQFDVRVDGEEVERVLTPGDLVLLRNAGLNPGVDDRVEHRVHPPVVGERISLGMRQEDKK